MGIEGCARVDVDVDAGVGAGASADERVKGAWVGGCEQRSAAGVRADTEGVDLCEAARGGLEDADAAAVDCDGFLSRGGALEVDG